MDEEKLGDQVKAKKKLFSSITFIKIHNTLHEDFPKHELELPWSKKSAAMTKFTKELQNSIYIRV